MATVVNNPAPAQAPATDSGNGVGFLLGVILLIAFVVLLLFYGIPYVTRSFAGPSVNVPGNVNVNVHGVPGGSK